MVDLKSWLQDQEAANTLRKLRPLKRLGGGRIKLLDNAAETAPLLDFSSNDYLALSEHPTVINASREALEKYGSGAGAARLMSGDLEINHRLEHEIAQLKGKAAALIFGSGYMANTGIIPALMDRNNVIFTDRLNHASIYDGCRLSGAKLVRFHHNDLNHLEELLKEKRGSGQALIVVESIYSMDGDRCPLENLVALKERFGCLLMVDEAHATGIFGPTGGGLIEEDEVGEYVDLAMGTFGKALGSYGAYVAASQEMIDYLVNRARSFIYSTALPPATIAASLAAVKLIRNEPQLRKELRNKVDLFKKSLRQGKITADLGPSQIIPLVVGESAKAVEIANQLQQQGIFATAIRPPTVPKGSARLRFSITRHFSEADLKKTAALLAESLQNLTAEY